MATTAARSTPLSAIAWWMCVPLAALQAVNAARAIADPAGFATYMGAPLMADDDGAWVLIYALRTAFIALLVASLLIRRDLQGLKWTALVALVMPLGDAWVVHQGGAAIATVVRHLAIAGYVALTAGVLFTASAERKP